MENEAALFKALADPTRLRLAALLASCGETCVCYLAGALAEPDYKISRHLAVMRSAGLVEARREGTWMHYRLCEEKSAFHQRLAAFLRQALAGNEVLAGDLERVRKTCCGVSS
ncbi:MAG: metalloregulator ArsR/SmtB family transcription factor [Candidatus Glassbacteria bacterium]